MKIGSLFSGAGMLDVAAQSVLGGTVAWHCENNPAAAAVLEHHWPDVPNLHDITAVDWDTVEPVDVLTGGWPCQPFSLAGKRKGADDERALWPYVAAAVRMVRPRLVVLENVSAVVTAGELARATAGLAALGYVGSWACVRASDVGAPHRRERVFIVAADTLRRELQRRRGPGRVAGPPRTDQGEGDQRQRDGHTADGGGRAPADAGGARGRQPRSGTPGPAEGAESEAGRRPARRGGGSPAADATRDGRHEGRPEPAWLVGRPDAAERGHAAADTEGGRRGPSGNPNDQAWADDSPVSTGDLAAADADRHGRKGDQELDGRAEGGQPTPRRPDPAGRVLEWGPYGPAIHRWEAIVGRPAPAPTEPNRNGKPRLKPHLPEWMMGWPDGWVTAVPGVSRNDQLRICGNGVVPQQAAYALEQLLGVDRQVATA